MPGSIERFNGPKSATHKTRRPDHGCPSGRPIGDRYRSVAVVAETDRISHGDEWQLL